MARPPHRMAGGVCCRRAGKNRPANLGGHLASYSSVQWDRPGRKIDRHAEFDPHLRCELADPTDMGLADHRIRRHSIL